jgi:hypothetical protein
LPRFARNDPAALCSQQESIVESRKVMPPIVSRSRAAFFD